MKTKICLLGICAFVTLVVAAPRTWVLKTGETVTGDYVSSGTTTLVVKTGGTNCFLKIADLATNDQAYIAIIKANQKQAQLDAEAAQMRAAGKMKFTVQLFENFPEKVVGHYGWIDAYFQGLNNSYVESKEDELGFGIRDENGDSYSKCRAIKRDPHNGNPDPVISEIMNLKRSDNFDANCSGDAASDLDPAVSGLLPSVFYRMGVRVIDLISRSVDLIDLDINTRFKHEARDAGLVKAETNYFRRRISSRLKPPRPASASVVGSGTVPNVTA